MEPIVKQYLLTHSFQELELEHGVCARQSTRDATKFSLNYDQLSAKSGDPLSEQCRGMVVRTKAPVAEGAPVGDVEVLAWPLNRFYNHGDPAASDIDMSSPDVRVYEKLDGTMIALYWDPAYSEWCCATRSVPEADVPFSNVTGMTFGTLFRRTFAELHSVEAHDFDEIVCDLDREHTYVFELTSPYNRIVVDYAEPGITLLAIRHTASGHEVNIHAGTLGLSRVAHPKSWHIRTIDDLVAFVNDADPMKLEGAVVVDSSFRRLKVKGHAYVLASKCRDTLVSQRNVLELIISGKSDDVLPVLVPELADNVIKMRDQLRVWCVSMDARFHSWIAESSRVRKDFAKLVVASGDPKGPHFDMFDGKVTSTSSWLEGLYNTGKLGQSVLDTVLKAIATTQHGLDAFFGKWPGNESDEQLSKALKDIS